jgi:hypothetical protein
MQRFSVVRAPLLCVALAFSVACSDTGSDSGSDEGGAAGEAGSAGSSTGGISGSGTGGTAGSATGGSAGSNGGSAGSATGGSSGSAMGGSAGSSSGRGGASGRGGTGGSGALCEDRTGGALVEFEIVEETFRVWIENAAFIAEAERLLDAGETRVPNFQTLIDGSDCDPQWSWHVDPNDVEFADFTIELCDAVPSYIEENKADWFDQVGQWCPWSARVTAVTQR